LALQDLFGSLIAIACVKRAKRLVAADLSHLSASQAFAATFSAQSVAAILPVWIRGTLTFLFEFTAV
jgi:hypothetical protein